MMSMPIVCPYSIGTVYYRPLHTPIQVQVPCPVCNGNRSVEIILGTGEQLTVPCEGCGLGFSFSRGYIMEWRYEPGATTFTIASIEGFSHDEWTLKSALGEQCSSRYLYASRDEALRVSTQDSLNQQEANAKRQSARKKDAKKLTWSVRYHRECIKDLERKIAYHQGKLQAPNEEATR